MTPAEKHRLRRERVAMEQGRTIRPYVRRGAGPKPRKEYKRLKRRELGVKSREQQRIEREAKEIAQANMKASRMKHDAHVRCFKSDANRVRRWRHANVPTYAIYHRMKRWMHKHLGDLLPSRKWSHHLGYTTLELRDHLERQFVKGMSWDNKGKWHIDHIVPVSSFHIDSVECDAFKDCFGLHNLRPVWAKENMRKGAKLEFLL